MIAVLSCLVLKKADMHDDKELFCILGEKVMVFLRFNLCATVVKLSWKRRECLLILIVRFKMCFSWTVIDQDLICSNLENTYLSGACKPPHVQVSYRWLMVVTLIMLILALYTPENLKVYHLCPIPPISFLPIDLIFGKMSSFQTFIHPEVGETSKKGKSPVEKSPKDEMGGEMSRLPKDIVLEIFSRLSIKDLKQCMWVRKSWYQTIHSPFFTKIHLEKSIIRSSHTVSLMVQNLNADDPHFSHDLYLVEYELSDDSVASCGVVPLKTKFKEMNAEYEFVGSCRGLICFSEPSIFDPVYVCNPVIGEYMTLPLTTDHPDIDIISGFGFDATTGKFKVIRMVYLSTEHTDDELLYDLEAEIYTVGSKDWRNIGVVPYPPRGDKPGVFLNGVLHWMCDRQLCPEEPYGIVCFDLASEQFSILPPPHGYGSDDIDTETEDGRFFEIKVLKGQLCYFDRRTKQVVAWVMKQYGVKQSWTRRFSLRELFDDFYPLNFTEGLPSYYEAFSHLPSLVSNREGRDEPAAVGTEGYFNLEQWSKNLCPVRSPASPHIVLPPNCPQKNTMYSHAYARVQSSKDSEVEHLIRYDQLYEYHEALAFKNCELSYVGSTSNADRTFDIPDTGTGSLINAAVAAQNDEANGETPKELTLDEFSKILGIN